MGVGLKRSFDELQEEGQDADEDTGYPASPTDVSLPLYIHRITNARDAHLWTVVPNPGGGACFQYTIAQWLDRGNNPGRKNTTTPRETALNINSCVVEALGKQQPGMKLNLEQ